MPKKKQQVEPDSVFFFKILLYFMIGTFWLRLENVGESDFTANIPFGLLLGIVFAMHEHFKIDRKIEYAILIVSTILSYYLPVGILISN